MTMKSHFIEFLNDELKNGSNKINVGKYGELDFSVEHFDQLLSLRDEVYNSILELKKKMKRAPAGHLRVNSHGKTPHYFRVTKKDDFHGEYIPRKNERLAESLAQKRIDEKYLEELEKIQRNLNRLIKKGKTTLDHVYLDLSPARQILVTPVRFPDREFEEIWSSVNYLGKSFEDDSSEIFTPEGMRVRSKSEILIVDALNRSKIPFRYECPLKLNGFGVVHPDFVCLDAYHRCVRVWEHFGMVDNPEYARKMIRKIYAYSENGFILGEGLLATFETSQFPLNARWLDSFVNTCFRKERVS